MPERNNLYEWTTAGHKELYTALSIYLFFTPLILLSLEKPKIDPRRLRAQSRVYLVKNARLSPTSLQRMFLKWQRKPEHSKETPQSIKRTCKPYTHNAEVIIKPTTLEV